MTQQTSNVTPIDVKQQQQQAQCEFVIHVTMRGFPVEIKGSGRAADLKIIIDRLLDAGAEPPTISPVSDMAPSKPAGPPLCPVHHSPMKASRKPGSFFCPRQAEDGSGYCPHKS